MLDIKKILDLTISMSSTEDVDIILERILDESMNISNCDAATLYIVKDNKLNFYITRNKTLGVSQGGKKEKLNLPPLDITKESVAGYVAITKKPLNISNVYEDDLGFSGPKKYDAITGYKTISMLVVPLIDRENNVIGVMQLLNAIDDKNNVIAFDKNLEDVIFALASESGILLSNRELYQNIKDLLDSFVKAMVKAIESRTPYNAYHTMNVAKLCGEFVDYLNNNGYEISNDDKEELVLAAMLHDIGKIITPLNVLNKATRFEGKLEIMKIRWNLIKSELNVLRLENKVSKEEYDNEIEFLDKAIEFVIKLDSMGFVSEEDRSFIQVLFDKKYETPFGVLKIIEDDEKDDALIIKGTLTPIERLEIEKHVVYTSRILEGIKFGKKYSNVKFIAGSHHEYLNGTGYPNKLCDKDIPILVRIITICDIYDSLTSTDRPYKKPIPKPIACKILTEMVGEGKLDGVLVEKYKEFVLSEDQKN